MAPKMVMQVLDAVNAGCETSDAVAATLGISVAAASAYLSELAKDGMIRRVGRSCIRFNRAGRRSHQYAPWLDP